LSRSVPPEGNRGQGDVVFEEVYEDDGEKKDTGISGEEQDFGINLQDLPRNIYYIIFTKDKYNPSSDSTIKDIKINSNKVLIVGTSLPLNEFDFYTRVGVPKIIGFEYWHSGKNQTIKVSGSESKTIDLDEDWKSKRYEEDLGVGEYNFEITTGVVWVYADAIAPSKENWFYLPQGANEKLIDIDVVVIDKNKLQINGNEVVYIGSIIVSKDSKFKIQVLDESQIYFERIKLILED